MNDLTLVIMAAGMGSRFGGLKQIEPVGPNGEFIIDYSIYDAIRAGFNKVVFIIKKENYDLFRETVGKRVEKQIKVEYAFQEIEYIPNDLKAPEGRTRPWGTGHAILCAKDVVKGNFAVINSDDFYGKEAYQVISDFFKEGKSGLEYLIVGYLVGNTLSENGAAKRGVCKADSSNYLTELVESSVERREGTIIAEPLNGGLAFEVSDNDLVSMNMFGFSDELFGYLENGFREFLIVNKDNTDNKCEYLIPDVVYSNVQDGTAKVKVTKTIAKWQGITYKEDKQVLVDEIGDNINKGVYPEKLWN